MNGSARSLRVVAYALPADTREGFDGLHGVVPSRLDRDPMCGELFLFVARSRKRAKVLMPDGKGLCRYAKRLGKGQFARLRAGEETASMASQ